MGLALFAIDPDGGEARARSGQPDRSAPALRQCGIFGMVWAESIASILYALPVLEKVNINGRGELFVIFMLLVSETVREGN